MQRVLSYMYPMPSQKIAAGGDLSAVRVVFDLDGTLVHAHECPSVCGGLMNGACFGLGWTAADGGTRLRLLSGLEADATVRICVHIRPGALSALKWCLMHTGGTGVWTAATPDYGRAVSEGLMRRIHWMHGEPRWPLAFVWTSDECERAIVHNAWGLYKPLSRLFAGAHAPGGWTPRNTLIVDNTPSVCAANPWNTLVVRTYAADAPGASRDTELVSLIGFLRDTAPLAMRHLDGVQWMPKGRWSFPPEETGAISLK